MHMLKKLTFISIIMLFSLTACGHRFDREQIPVEEKAFFGMIHKNQLKARPYRKQIFDHTPGGDSSYDQGFQDGCRSATSAIGEGFYRTHGPKIDGFRLTEDPWYLRGFQDASTYCTFNLDWETH